MRVAPRSLRGLGLGGVLLLVLIAAPLLVFQVGRSDLDVYRHGASVLVHGESLYSAHFGAGTVANLPFTYPPLAALAALVLLPLPESLVTPLWALATMMSIAWCVRASFAAVIDRQVTRAGLVWAALAGVALWTRPVFDHLGDGQVDILLMTLCLADATEPNPRWPRGLLVGVAAAIKLVPGLFILYFLITRQRRAAIVAGLTFVLCQGLAYAADPSDSHTYWTKLVFATERTGYTAGYKNQSLRGILLNLLPVSERSFVIGAAAVALAVVGLALARRTTLHGDPLGGATLTGLTAVMVSPVSWIHATVWLIPALGLLVGPLDRPRRTWTAVLISVSLLAGLPYLPNVVTGLPGPLTFLAQRSYGLICLVAILALPLLTSTDRNRRPSPAVTHS